MEFKIKYNLAYLSEAEEFSEDEFDQVLTKLDKKKSKDPEGLQNIILCKKNTRRRLRGSMRTIFSKIRRSYRWPKVMRAARITTIPKPGSTLELTNK